MTSSCSPAGTYSFAPSCTTCPGDTPPYAGPSTITLDMTGMPTQLPPGCQAMFMGLECRLTLMCTQGTSSHTVVFDLAAAKLTEVGGMAGSGCQTQCSSPLTKQGA